MFKGHIEGGSVDFLILLPDTWMLPAGLSFNCYNGNFDS